MCNFGGRTEECHFAMRVSFFCRSWQSAPKCWLQSLFLLFHCLFDKQLPSRGPWTPLIGSQTLTKLPCGIKVTHEYMCKAMHVKTIWYKTENIFACHIQSIPWCAFLALLMWKFTSSASSFWSELVLASFASLKPKMEQLAFDILTANHLLPMQYACMCPPPHSFTWECQIKLLSVQTCWEQGNKRLIFAQKISFHSN